MFREAHPSAQLPSSQQHMVTLSCCVKDPADGLLTGSARQRTCPRLTPSRWEDRAGGRVHPRKPGFPYPRRASPAATYSMPAVPACVCEPPRGPRHNLLSPLGSGGGGAARCGGGALGADGQVPVSVIFTKLDKRKKGGPSADQNVLGVRITHSSGEA
jgi:hypothetical protein